MLLMWNSFHPPLRNNIFDFIGSVRWRRQMIWTSVSHRGWPLFPKVYVWKFASMKSEWNVFFEFGKPNLEEKESITSSCCDSLITNQFQAEVLRWVLLILDQTWTNCSLCNTTRSLLFDACERLVKHLNVFVMIRKVKNEDRSLSVYIQFSSSWIWTVLVSECRVGRFSRGKHC